MSAVHVLRGRRYAGVWHDPTIAPAAEHPDVVGPTEGWVTVTETGGTMILARPEDLFDTEADARAEARNRRNR